MVLSPENGKAIRPIPNGTRYRIAAATTSPTPASSASQAAPRRREAQARGEPTSGSVASSWSSSARAVDTSTCRTGGSREAQTTTARKTIPSRVSSHMLSVLRSGSASDAPIMAIAATSGRQSATARKTCATPAHTDAAEPLTTSA